jgi:hypothetical protein
MIWFLLKVRPRLQNTRTPSGEYPNQAKNRADSKRLRHFSFGYSPCRLVQGGNLFKILPLKRADFGIRQNGEMLSMSSKAS